MDIIGSIDAVFCRYFFPVFIQNTVILQKVPFYVFFILVVSRDCCLLNMLVFDVKGSKIKKKISNIEYSDKFVISIVFHTYFLYILYIGHDT